MAFTGFNGKKSTGKTKHGSSFPVASRLQIVTNSSDSHQEEGPAEAAFEVQIWVSTILTPIHSGLKELNKIHRLLGFETFGVLGLFGSLTFKLWDFWGFGTFGVLGLLEFCDFWASATFEVLGLWGFWNF